ncbi:sulfotransferase [Aurantimonas sp. VKM B-3413]|uniref:sulfotransferase n=1 Tax=Aurantimonas sp. VKM B-3413 TaxID=2779401 RepID=UPI001E46E5D9|nr:sulfotransferase [Aurantimonas sp. VKM B-3413]MCB8836934.1 sulfotransferase [Aurantimonas sp. VKM B-3413]
MTIRIALWSGPRNISTAMMRSFGARPDTAVSDEPFFGCYLKASGERQPMADETMASMDCDFRSVLAAMKGPAPEGKSIWYQKHMPHHMVGDVSIADMPDHRHAFLIRTPERVVASYAAKHELTRPEVLGYGVMRRYFEHEAERTGRTPAVIDSDDVLADPAGTLEALCDALDIPWTDAMLRWTAGPHREDGVWSKHWYGQVNASIGFAPPPKPAAALPPSLAAIAEACRDDYEALFRHRLVTTAGD